MHSMNYLAIQISYLEHLISELPDGNFGKYRGKQVLYIYRMPSDPKVCWSNNRRYCLETKRGNRMCEEVRKSNLLKNKHNMLMDDWKSNYVGVPPKIQMPYKRQSKMNYEFFDSSLENQNPNDTESLLEYNNRKFRSKNEVLAAQILDKMNIEYKVEPRFSTGSKYFYPDFIIGVKELDKSAYVEIYGKMDDMEYVSANSKKNGLYFKAGLRQGRDYIPFYSGDAKTFDVEAFEMQIKAWLELAAEEIVRQAAGEGEKT
ncbi:MAG: hypothetical protein J6U23_10025 [Clostridiales bacterium]|nr:hypothetical protein [Clostridiales bacterium]